MQVSLTDSEILVRNILIRMGDYKPDLILGLTRGGLIPAVRLSHILDVEMISVNKDMLELFLGKLHNKNVLIVDDINDTGKTLGDLSKFLVDFNINTKIASVKYAVLINNLPSPFKVDFFGVEIDKSVNPAWVDFWWEDK